MKTVFTTGEAAEICKVSQQTIIRCFDSGRLKGFRVPGSRFRRIPREALLQFMKDKYGQQLPSVISLATGPSRTADIEKTLVVGVHGPKEVYLFLVEDLPTF